MPIPVTVFITILVSGFGTVFVTRSVIPVPTAIPFLTLYTDFSRPVPVLGFSGDFVIFVIIFKWFRFDGRCLFFHLKGRVAGSLEARPAVGAHDRQSRPDDKMAVTGDTCALSCPAGRVSSFRSSSQHPSSTRPSAGTLIPYVPSLSHVIVAVL